MTGPSEETLAKLAWMLPSMADGVARRTAPRYTCPACLKLWGKNHPEEIIASKVCKKCKYALKGGAVIFICDDQRYLIVKPKAGSDAQINPEWAGRIVKIDNSVMDEMFKTET